MRLDEFVYDLTGDSEIADLQMEDVRKMLLDQPELYENTSDFKSIESFLKTHSVLPVINTAYYLTSITTVPLARIISISVAPIPGVFVKSEGHNLYFDFGHKVKVFPYVKNEKDALQFTILSDSQNQQEQFLTLLLLTFGEWRISQKITII